MTRIVDMDRIYEIVKTGESAEYPQNQVSVVSKRDVPSGDYDTFVDAYGTVSSNAVFDFNSKTFELQFPEHVFVKNHTNKTLRLHCTSVQSGGSGDYDLSPNMEKMFDTEGHDGPEVNLTITVLNVVTYNKPPRYVRGFVS